MQLIAHLLISLAYWDTFNK